LTETFSDRMRFLRRQLGARGEDTASRAFAREMEVHYAKLHAWERRGNFPRGGLEELTAAFARVPAVKDRRLDPAKIAAWAYSGDGPPPISAPDTYSARASTPSAARPAASSSSTTTPSGGVFVDQKTPVPWRALLSLVQQGKNARDAGDLNEEAAVRQELLQLMKTFGVTDDQLRSSGSQPDTHQ